MHIKCMVTHIQTHMLKHIHIYLLLFVSNSLLLFTLVLYISLYFLLLLLFLFLSIFISNTLQYIHNILTLKIITTILWGRGKFNTIHPIFVKKFHSNQKCQLHGGARGKKGPLKSAGFILWKNINVCTKLHGSPSNTC